MNVDDDLLSEVLTDRVSDIHADPELLAAVRTRSQRRRIRLAVLTAGVAATTAIAATIAIVAPGHGTGQATVLSGAGALASTQAAPAFPLTPTYLPDGLGPARTLMIAGQTVLRYDPAGAADSPAAITISVGATAPAGVYPTRPSTPATVDGKPAQVMGSAAIITTVLFTRQPTQVVAVTGNGSYASTPTLLAVAASLTDRPVAATPPFIVSDLPAEVGPVNAYDTTSMSFGPDAQSPTLSITYLPGVEVAPTGAALGASSSPSLSSSVSTAAPPSVSPSIASVDDSRPHGVLHLSSSVLDADQLLQLAPHVVITADSNVVDVPPGPSTVVAQPPQAPTTLPSAGPQPTDPNAAVKSVQAAFHTAFTAEPAGHPYASLSAVDGGSLLHGALDQLRTNFPQAVQTVSVTTGKVVFTSPTTASLQFTLTYTGGAPYGTEIGKALLANGTWLVTRDTYCDVLSFGGATCPTG